MKWTGLALMTLILVTSQADAGIFSRKKNQPEEVPGGHPPMVTTNGTVVPTWAAKRIRESPVPLYSKSWGRRPWALALSTQRTPSAVWARADQLGYGAGPTPGFTNGPSGAGANYPLADVGPGNPNGWGSSVDPRNVFMPGSYPLILGTGASGN